MLDRRTLVKGMALTPFLSVAAGRAQAAVRGAGRGPAVLTVEGAINPPDGAKVCKFDRPRLESLGMTTLTTSTAWTAQTPVFEGVLARDLLDAVGAEGEEVVARALNDYVVTIPLQELYSYPVLFALKMDGEYLRIRDKGPIWIVYPRDQHPELRNPLTDKKWIWQLNHIEIR